MIETYRTVPPKIKSRHKWWRRFSCWKNGHNWEEIPKELRDKRPWRPVNTGCHIDYATQVCSHCGAHQWGDIVHAMEDYFLELRETRRRKLEDT